MDVLCSALSFVRRHGASRLYVRVAVGYSHVDRAGPYVSQVFLEELLTKGHQWPLLTTAVHTTNKAGGGGLCSQHKHSFQNAIHNLLGYPTS